MSSQDVKNGAAWEATQGMFFLVLVSFLLLSVLFFIYQGKEEEDSREVDRIPWRVKVRAKLLVFRLGLDSSVRAKLRTLNTRPGTCFFITFPAS